MKIALFFGSFNPIHIGHLIIAEHIVSFFTDKVWFVVSPQNPLKETEELLGIKDRISLIDSILEKNLNFQLSTVELDLPKPSYTIDTLYELKKIHPQHDFFLIMGSDNFLNINKWKSYKILLNNYKFLIYQRPSFQMTNNKIPNNVKLLNGPLINISSTQIRNLIKENISIRYLVPDKVISMIKKNSFYRNISKNN